MKTNYLKSLLLLSLLSVSGFAQSIALMEEAKLAMKSKVPNGESVLVDTKMTQVMVMLKEGIDPKGAYQSFLKTNGIQSNIIEMVKSFSLVGDKTGIKTTEKQHLLVLKSNKLSIDELLRQAKKINGAEVVEIDELIYLTATPNDARYPELWGMHNDGTYGTVDADSDVSEAWDLHRGSRNIVIGIIDTGIDYNHEDLVNNIWTNPNEIPNNGVDDDNNGYIDDIHGIDARNNDSDPMDDHYHGTHVAGTLGAEGNNSLGVTGVNWRTSIASCKFLGPSGRTSDAIECVNYFTDLKLNHGINIVVTNNSWGGGSDSLLLYNAIASSGDNEILFVASAGNNNRNNDNRPAYPASYDLDNIISVAATNSNDSLASFSNYGVTSVDLAAPGVDILSTFLNQEPNVCTPNDNQVFYFEGFESNLTNWYLHTYDTNFSEGGEPLDLVDEHFKVDSSDSFSGNYSLTETLSETYNNYRNQSANLNYGTIDLSTVAEDEGVCLSFQIKGKVADDSDHFSLYVSGGGEYLSIIIDETYDDWTRVSLQLPLEFFVNNVAIQLSRYNDSSGVEIGYNIDDLKISTGDIEVPVSNTYVSLSGTSMAAPHVTGAVALLAAAYPRKSSADFKEIILDSVDKIDELDGVVETGGRLNIHKMLELAENYESTVDSDFNGDGYSDILVQNTVNFNLNGWFGSESGDISSESLTILNATTDVVGQADINGDGFLDVILRNHNTGVLTALRGSATEMVCPKYLKTLTEVQEVIALADINGDGYDDILLKNRVNLRVNVLLGSTEGTVTNQYLKTLNEPQEIVEVFDVNGDGYDDIIVKNNNNRRVNAWLSDENSMVRNQYLKTLPPVVEIVEVTDFNNDGYGDLIVQNSVNLRVNAWLTDGNGSIENQYIKTLSPNLDIAGITDINGDNFSDIIVSNRVNNRVNAWLNTSGTGVVTHYIKTLNTGAKLVDFNDINGDGYDDVIIENETGRVSAWLGSSTATITNKYLKTLTATQEILTP